MSTRTLTIGATLIGLVVAFFVSGCYTQLARPGLDRDRVYEDNYYYEELDKAEEAEADTVVQHRHDVYIHDWYPYDSWWYGWDPYYAYPMQSYWYWRHYNYWDPWYSGYAYWGDPWYWAPFSYYGGYAYYGGYYYRPYGRYYLVDDDYFGKQRPFQRLDTFRDRTRLANTPGMTTVAAKPGSVPSTLSRTRTANDAGKRAISRTAEPRTSGTATVPRTNTVQRERTTRGQPPVIDRRVTNPKTKVKLESMESLRQSIARSQSSTHSRSSSSSNRSTDSGISQSRSSSSPPSISRSSGSSSRSSGSSSGSSSGTSSSSSSSRTRVKK